MVLRSWEGGEMFCYFRKVIAVAISYARNLACSVRGNCLISLSESLGASFQLF